MATACEQCGKETITINTYKHHWIVCDHCGYGKTVHKSFPIFSFLPYKPLKKNNRALDEKGSIYDYFVNDNHIEHSIASFDEFMKDIVDEFGIELKGKRILDVSGGNGHFVSQFEKHGASFALTELNDKAIEYAKNKLDLEVVKFDFDTDKLSDLFDEKFDIVLLRAALMFCVDVPSFLKDVKNIMADGGLLVHNHNVVPTLGMCLRTQCDEYSYRALYQPELLEEMHGKEGFELVGRRDETDPSLYVYQHDHTFILYLLKMFYEIPAMLKLRKMETKYPFRARDRRRSNLVFRKTA